MYKLYLKKNEEKRLKLHEALVYANEIDKIVGKDNNGSISYLYSYDNKFIGKGYINHLSKVILRILSRDENEIIDKEFFKERIRNAYKYRMDIGYSGSYRLLFSESDLIPGLIIDRYEDTFVIEISSLGLELNKEYIIESLIELFNPKCIYEKCEMNLRIKEGLKDSSGLLYGELPDEVIITENGLNLSIDIVNGQKTGYFLDQRENRYAVRSYTKNKEVLDCFSNSGGFSMNACTNASHVTAIDISKKATDNVLRNAKLNGFNNIDVITDDVFKVLRGFKKDGRLFDTIILDPPAFTKSVSEVKDALRGYKDINILAMKLIRKGGYLITSSCSHYISFNLFEKMLIEASKESNRLVRLIELKTQAKDHLSILSNNDTTYLKFYCLKIE